MRRIDDRREASGEVVRGDEEVACPTTKNKWSTHEHSHPHPATQRARSGFGCTPRACTSTHPASTRPTRRSEVRSECDARAQRVARKDGGGEAVVPFLSVSIK